MENANSTTTEQSNSVEADSTTPDYGQSLNSTTSDYEDFIFHSINSSPIFKLENLDDLDRILEEDAYELPKSLIITNMDIRIFNDSSEQRTQFENAFQQLDPNVTFLYFKSFRRARVDFTLAQAATKARILCNQMRIGDEAINCYYAEICDMVSNMLLRPPALEKQFLISPPASPPEGWAPVEEAQPVLNIDLQSALAKLIPGSTHELHPATDNQPGIVVHICPDTTSEPASADPTTNCPQEEFTQPRPKMKIAQTPCPPSMASTAQHQHP